MSMRKHLLTCLCGVMAAGLLAGPAIAQDLSYSLEYRTKYMSKGLDLNEDGAVACPEISADLPNNMYAGIWGAFSVEDRHETVFDKVEWGDYDEYDFYVGTYGDLADGFIEWDFVYLFLWFPDYHDGIKGEDIDYHEVTLSTRFPKLLPGDTGLTPYASVTADFADDRDRDNAIDNQFYQLGIDTEIAAGPVALAPYAETWFNGGQANSIVAAGETESGHSHTILGMRAAIEIGPVTVTPGAHYQWSHEDTVNGEDDFWATLKVSLN